MEGLLIDFLADVFHDPVLKWQAEQVAKVGQKNTTKWREWYIEDVIATGGSIQAACDLIRYAGGEVTVIATVLLKGEFSDPRLVYLQKSAM